METPPKHPTHDPAQYPEEAEQLGMFNFPAKPSENPFEVDGNLTEDHVNSILARNAYRESLSHPMEHKKNDLQLQIRDGSAYTLDWEAASKQPAAEPEQVKRGRARRLARHVGGSTLIAAKKFGSTMKGIDPEDIDARDEAYAKDKEASAEKADERFAAKKQQKRERKQARADERHKKWNEKYPKKPAPDLSALDELKPLGHNKNGLPTDSEIKPGKGQQSLDFRSEEEIAKANEEVMQGKRAKERLIKDKKFAGHVFMLQQTDRRLITKSEQEIATMLIKQEDAKKAELRAQKEAEAKAQEEATVREQQVRIGMRVLQRARELNPDWDKLTPRLQIEKLARLHADLERKQKNDQKLAYELGSRMFGTPLGDAILAQMAREDAERKAKEDDKGKPRTPAGTGGRRR